MKSRVALRSVSILVAVGMAAVTGLVATVPAQATPAPTPPATPAAAVRKVALSDPAVSSRTLADTRGNIWSLEEHGLTEVHADGSTTFFAAGGGRYPMNFAVAPDGDVWYTSGPGGSSNTTVTRIAADGQVTDFADALVGQVIIGPDGTVWQLGYPTDVQRIGPDGTITRFSTGSEVTAHAFASDGTLWFGAGDTVGWASPTAATASTLTTGRVASSMMVAADGSTWLAESGAIASIHSSHTLTAFALPGNETPTDLIQLGDGSIWFSASAGGAAPYVGKVASGVVTTFDIGATAQTTLGNMVLGPNGDLWLSDQLPDPNQGLLFLDRVVRVAPDGTYAKFLTDQLDDRITLTVAPDGTLWYQTQYDGALSSPDETRSRYTATVGTDGSLRNLVQTGWTAGGVTFDSTGNAWTLDYDDGALFEIWPTSTSRVSSTDRFATSVAIAQANYPTTAPIVFVASGTNYPDALSAGPAAAVSGGPLLLTAPQELPQVVADEITSLAPARIVVVGGPNAVSDAVLARLGQIAPTTRVFGADRYDTSRTIVQDFFHGGAAAVFVATASNFPDALAAGAAAGSLGFPLLLVNGSATTVDDPTLNLIHTLRPSRILVAGGVNAVSDAVAYQLSLITLTTRLSGADRFETAAAVDEFVYPATRTIPNALIATGMNFPDALSASAWAASTKSPLFVASAGCVPARTLGDIIQRKSPQVTVVGGTSALTPAIDQLTSC
ncbi:cell wall-binding repeat-containing protein [Leifsonia sp. NPDC056665]|uniref:cell wall-binding repeat-containing protein n=1 Tax=Leifsonia sp. NPDC056665 TaxID=3345901 RepID=UPI00368443CD